MNDKVCSIASKCFKSLSSLKTVKAIAFTVDAGSYDISDTREIVLVFLRSEGYKYLNQFCSNKMESIKK